jgi:hypothetical protein
MQFTADKCTHTYLFFITHFLLTIAIVTLFTSKQNGETVHVTKYLSQFRFSYTPSDKEASEVCAKKRTQILSAVLSHTFEDRILSRGGQVKWALWQFCPTTEESLKMHWFSDHASAKNRVGKMSIVEFSFCPFS